MQALDMSIFTKVPFPGLRSFEQTEKEIFFGRDRQLDELLRKLRSNRFLAVVGTPSSGKSSLVKASLVPKLEEGFAGQAGSSWRIAVCCPGANPLQNLSKQLAQRGVLHSDEMMDPNFPAVVEGMLRRGSLGIVEAFKQSDIKRGENLMIVIDQFEEIFRYSQKSPKHHEEAAAFVNLILNASRQKEQPIYIIITMRSNFLGACTDFRGLPESINDGQFLIPRMKTEDLKKVIIGPIKSCGADIEPDLVNRIVGDLGEELDELGTLQHALMRMWDQWLNMDGGDTSVKISDRHYEGVGTVKGALSKHAEEAYSEMDSEEKRMICQRMFRALVEKGSDGQPNRRPQTIREIMKLNDTKDLKLIRSIVYSFSQPSRLFLSAPEFADIDEESTVSIAHESLIQRWSTLNEWVQEENLAAEEYLRLSAAAALYYEGKGSLLRDPELTLGLKWFDPAKYDPEHPNRLAPTQNWSERYNSIFFETVEFLKESERERDRQLAMVKGAQDEQMKKARRMALGGILVALFCLLLLAFAVAAGDKARRSAKIAAKNAEEAKRQRFLAEMSKQEAARRAFEAHLQAALAQEEKNKADQATMIAMRSSELALEQAAKAREAETNANKAALKAFEETAKAELAAKKADEAAKLAAEKTQLAIKEKNNALRLKGLNLAQSVAVKSWKDVSAIENPQVQGALAREAYKLNQINEGKPYDPFIYESVYKALNKLEGEAANPQFNELDQTPEGTNRNGTMRAIRVAPPKGGESDKFVYTTGSDGWLLKWKFQTYKTRQEKYLKENKPEAIAKNTNDRVYRTMDISSDGKYLVRAGDEAFVEVYDLDKGTSFKLDPHQRNSVWSLVMIPKTKDGNYGFYSVGNDRKLRYTNIGAQNSTVLIDSLPSKITNIDFAVNERKRFVVGCGFSPLVRLWEMPNNVDGNNFRVEELILRNERNANVNATAVAIDPLGRFVAAGFEDGSLLIWDLEEMERDAKSYQPFRSGAHASIINDIEFSKDGYRMVVGSSDKSATLWLIRDPYSNQFGFNDVRAYPYKDSKFQPIRLDNHRSWVTAVTFDFSGKRLITGTSDGAIKIWDVDPREYAEKICDHLQNNLSNSEWKKFIGTDGTNDNDLYIATPNGERRPYMTCEGKAQRK